MRVLEVVHALPPATYGGTELYARDLAAALSDRGHEVAVATPRGAEADEAAEAAGDAENVEDAEAGKSAEDAGIPGVETVALPDPGGETAPAVGERPLPAVERPATDDEIAALLDEFDPDVVHCQHLKHLSAGIPELCDDRGVPCVLTLHDFWTICHREQLYRPEGRPCAGPESVRKCADCYRRARDGVATDGGKTDGDTTVADSEDVPSDAEDAPSDAEEAPTDAETWDAVARRSRRLRRALDAADRLVAPSAFLRERMAEFGVPGATLVHRRNGVQVDRFENPGFDPQEPLRVGYAGRVAPSKGVHLLVEAVRRVADRSGAGIELHVFGRFDPADDDYHARLTDAAGEETTFRGWYADRPDPYREIDVLVLPSVWYENSPLVIQEAFAAGVPVVAADAGGMAELVTDGEDGLTFRQGDSGALADRLSELAADPSLVAELREGVTEPKRLADHAGEMVDLYRAVRDEDGDEDGNRDEDGSRNEDRERVRREG